MKTIFPCFVLLAWAQAAGVPTAAFEAHLYADKVLKPKFSSAFNEWSLQHPQDAPGKDNEHALRLSRGDHERFQTVRKAWKEFDEAMKRAGY